MEMNCMQCQGPLHIRESLFVQKAGDWRQPYLDFQLHRLLLSISFDAMKFKKDHRCCLMKAVFIHKGL